LTTLPWSETIRYEFSRLCHRQANADIANKKKVIVNFIQIKIG